MRGVTESLAGRVGIVNLLGFSRREATSALDPADSRPFLPEPPKDRQIERMVLEAPELYELIWRGSMPALCVDPGMDRDVFYGSYLQTYLQRDVRDLTQVGDLMAFTRFIRACAARTGRLLVYSDLANDVDISVPTAKQWLSILETSFQVHLLRPYHSNITKRLVKTPKLYFYDTGFCSYLTGWSSPTALMNGAMAGPIFETYVFSELLKSWWFAAKEPRLAVRSHPGRRGHLPSPFGDADRRDHDGAPRHIRGVTVCRALVSAGRTLTRAVRAATYATGATRPRSRSRRPLPRRARSRLHRAGVARLRQHDATPTLDLTTGGRNDATQRSTGPGGRRVAVTPDGEHTALPDIEITVRFPGSCIALVAGGRMLYRRPEIVKEESDRICAHALLDLVPAAEALALRAAGGGEREVPEIVCTSPGCGAIFSMRALTPEESASLGTPSSVSARQPVAESAHSKRITKRLSKIDDPTDTPLLSRLEPELVQEIADLSLVSQYDTPTIVIEEGQEGQALYIVGEGELEVVTQTAEGEDLVLATLRKGECFGEISLMTGQPATATVRSKGTHAAVLVLPREKLDDLLIRRKALHREFSRIVAYRLYRNNVALEAESHQGLNGRLSMIGVIDLIQTLHASRRTGTLGLNDASRTARIGFRDGEVSSATLDAVAGPDAFFDIIGWEDGYFSFEGGEPTLDATPGAALSGGTMGLLMEGLRRMDEKGRPE